MARPELVLVEIACGDRQHQKVVELSIPKGDTVAKALERSAVLDCFPDLLSKGYDIAIYGKLVATDHRLQGGERLDVVGPLEVDPKEARRRRAALKAQRTK